MEKNKKMIAAVSAVVNYIKNEEDQMRMQAANPVIAAGQFQSAPLAPVKMWGMNGRMSMMQIRNLMQVKAFHSF